jgi:uncharacterized protein (TIGR02391 family)
MILTDREMSQVRSTIEAQAGLDAELLQRCEHLIHLGAFDEAVRSAFVLLEERLRKAVGGEGMTGTQLANHAFNPTSGALSKHLGRDQAEREGLRELYSGAFKLFRNPTAHGVVGYSAAEGKAIISLVNLMLKMLERVEELPPPGLFSENVEAALGRIEQAIGPGATSRLRVFLGKTVEDLGLKPTTGAKQWIPFRAYCLYKADQWQEPRPHPVAVFYLKSTDTDRAVYFPTSYYYRQVVGFDVGRLIEELTDLGFVLSGKDLEPVAALKLHNDQEFFDSLLSLVDRTVDELGATLQQQAG